MTVEATMRTSGKERRVVTSGACAACRRSHVRCVWTESGSCKRCLSKGIECSSMLEAVSSSKSSQPSLRSSHFSSMMIGSERQMSFGHEKTFDHISLSGDSSRSPDDYNWEFSSSSDEPVSSLLSSFFPTSNLSSCPFSVSSSLSPSESVASSPLSMSTTSSVLLRSPKVDPFSSSFVFSGNANDQHPSEIDSIKEIKNRVLDQHSTFQFSLMRRKKVKRARAGVRGRSVTIKLNGGHSQPRSFPVRNRTFVLDSFGEDIQSQHPTSTSSRLSSSRKRKPIYVDRVFRSSFRVQDFTDKILPTVASEICYEQLALLSTSDAYVGSLSCSRFGDPYPEACMSYVLTDPITEKEEGDLHPYNLSDSDTLVEISPLKDRGPFFSEQGSPVAWNPSTPFTSVVTSAFEDCLVDPYQSLRSLYPSKSNATEKDENKFSSFFQGVSPCPSPQVDVDDSLAKVTAGEESSPTEPVDAVDIPVVVRSSEDSTSHLCGDVHLNYDDIVGDDESDAVNTPLCIDFRIRRKLERYRAQLVNPKSTSSKENLDAPRKPKFIACTPIFNGNAISIDQERSPLSDLRDDDNFSILSRSREIDGSGLFSVSYSKSSDHLPLDDDSNSPTLSPFEEVEPWLMSSQRTDDAYLLSSSSTVLGSTVSCSIDSEFLPCSNHPSFVVF